MGKLKDGVTYVGGQEHTTKLEIETARSIYSNLCAMLPPYYADIIQQKASQNSSFVDWKGKRYLVNHEIQAWMLVRDVCELVGQHFLEISRLAGQCVNLFPEMQKISKKNDKKQLRETMYSMTDKEQLDSDDYEVIEDLMNEIKKGNENYEDDDEQ